MWESEEESEAAAELSMAAWLLFFGLLLFAPILFIAQSVRPNSLGEHSDVWLILAVCSIWCVVLPVAWSTRVAIGRWYHRDQNWTPRFGVAESAVGSQLCFLVGSGVVYSALDGWVDTGVVLVFFVVTGGLLAVGVGYSFRFLRSGSTRPQQETKSPSWVKCRNKTFREKSPSLAVWFLVATVLVAASAIAYGIQIGG